MIVNKINKIWSLDLAYVDKLANYHRGVWYLLVAVYCLSPYLRVETLKTKNAEEIAESFKKVIKTKQPKLVWNNQSLKIVAIPNVTSPIYSLIDAEKDEISRKFYEKKLIWLEQNQILTKMASVEFTVFLISTASIDYFPGKTLVSFGKFCKMEIALDGYCRVALSLSQIVFHWN